MADDDGDFGPVLRGGARDDAGTAPAAQSATVDAQDRPDDGDGWLPPSVGRGTGRQDGDEGPGDAAPSPVAVPVEGDDPGPVMRGRGGILPRRAGTGGRTAPALPRARTVRRAVSGLLGLALVFLLALSVIAAVRVERVDVDGLSPGPAGATTILLVGSDSRDGLSEEELLALGTEAVEGRRTDTILLLEVKGGRAAALSFPRDLVARRCDGSSGRINGAYASGGPSCLVQTVQALSGIPIAHYAEVDFAGFLGIVDAVGGVQIQLDEPLVDRLAGVDLPAGCQTLDGRQSLGFVRSREVDSDLGRIARQQRFVAQLARSAVRPVTLLNPLRLTRITLAATDAMTVDRGFGPLTTLRLLRAAPGVAGGGLATVTVPARPGTLGGADVLVPTDEAPGVFAGFADGSVLDPPPAAPPAAAAPGSSLPGQESGDVPDASAEGTAAGQPVGAGAPGATCGG